jgi:hypothetical protein
MKCCYAYLRQNRMQPDAVGLSGPAGFSGMATAQQQHKEQAYC